MTKRSANLPICTRSFIRRKTLLPSWQAICFSWRMSVGRVNMIRTWLIHGFDCGRRRKFHLFIHRPLVNNMNDNWVSFIYTHLRTGFYHFFFFSLFFGDCVFLFRKLQNRRPKRFMYMSSSSCPSHSPPCVAEELYALDGNKTRLLPGRRRSKTLNLEMKSKINGDSPGTRAAIRDATGW